MREKDIRTPEVQQVRLGEWFRPIIKVEENSSPLCKYTLNRFDLEGFGLGRLGASEDKWMTVVGEVVGGEEAIYTPFGPIIEADSEGRIIPPFF